MAKAIDFSNFCNGRDWERTALAEELTQNFERNGYVKLFNHGIPDSIVDEIFPWARRFFALPNEVKNKVRHEAGPNPQRGWGPLGAETSARLREKNGEPSKKLTDEKEHFDSGPPGDLEYPSIWPPEEEFPGFRAFMDAYFDACHAAAMLIMEALEIGLKLPHGALTGKCTPPVSELRLNRYPSVNTAKFKEGLTKRNWSHSDFGVITLLFQDDVGGLELENRDHPGSFVPATKESPRELLVLISDTFQRWSNGVIRSGLHQVGPPPHLKGNKDCILPERYSAVFFFKANRNKSVGPLPQFVGPEQPAQYEDITALQLHQQLTSVLYN